MPPLNEWDSSWLAAGILLAELLGGIAEIDPTAPHPIV
jgi:hypothetical protein